MDSDQDMYYNTIYQQAYEGAEHHYKNERANLLKGSPDTLAARELLHLQLRSAHAVRNNGYASAAKNKYVENLKELTVSWLNPKGKAVPAMQSMWDEFADSPSLDGYGNLGTMQTVWNSSMFQSGNTFVRLQIRRTGNKNKVPLKLEHIPSEFHDCLFRGANAIDDIRYGIQFEDSAPTNYFFQRGRIDSTYIPGEMAFTRTVIPANEILHMFKREYPGQWLGIPMLAPVLIPLYALDTLTDATIAKQQAAQAISWIIENTNPMAITPVGAPGKILDNKEKEKIIFRASGGNVQYLNKGEKINFYQSTDIGQNLLPFIQAELRRIAASCGIPYHQLTGDYSGINFSTLRGIAIELRNRIEFIQHFFLIPTGMLPLTTRFKELAVLQNPRVSQAFPSFQLPRFYGADELKDAQADVLEIQNGLATLKSKLDERHTTFEEIAADRERIAELGLTNLLNPTNQNGQPNNTEANSNSVGNA